MEFTEPAYWVNKPFTGYVMNAEFSEDKKQEIAKLVHDIQNTFKGAVLGMPQSAMHITLLDWIAPLEDYGGQDKDELFTQIQPSYDRAITEALSSFKQIRVHFNELRVSPSTIFLVGHDDGQFQNIRDRFLEKVELLPGTKLPPAIIHSSLARFTKQIDLNKARTFCTNKLVDITQEVSSFRLVHTTREPMLEFKVLKRYLVG